MATERIVPATGEALAEAAAALRSGRLVVFPTETVYGLGADATSDRAVAAVFEAKGRPRFNPLIVHLAEAAAASRLGRLDMRARRLAERFWPGPLTLVVPRLAGCPVSLLASAGLETLALRVPAHPVARRLLELADLPVVAPSANRSGRVSPTTARHAEAEIGDRVAMILDGGPCAVGVESTVVALADSGPPRLLRPGAVTREALEAEVGPLASPPDGGPIAAPGMLESHYAPVLPVRLGARRAEPGEALLAFGPDAPAEAAANLSPSGDLVEAAANLFAMLHRLDRPGATGIAVMPVPETGLGEAINDRLRRAAAPRRPPPASGRPSG